MKSILNQEFCKIALALGLGFLVTSSAFSSTLECKKKSGEDVIVDIGDKSVAFALVDQQHTNVQLLQNLLPQIPRSLIRAYGCVAFKVSFEKAQCSFTELPEVFTCNTSNEVVVRIDAALACNQAAQDWDHYTANANGIKLVSENLDSDGKTQHAFYLTLSPNEDAQALNSSQYKLYQESFHNTTQGPECKVNGLPISRP